ncbi:MAG: hydrogenase maturation protease [Thermomicrobiales bacterium]|jgi:hydrogenase maturation protease|nr:MAG: hydrogenase maturation protease [Thermomicrobiales bacterium]
MPTNLAHHKLSDRPASRRTVLAVGNFLLKDDGVGIHLLRRLISEKRRADVQYVDGGTLGFTLAPLIEETDLLVVLDAMRFGASPGTVAVKVGADLDRFVARKRVTAHEVNLRDLLDIARIRGSLPPARALVGIEPESVEWGLDPTATVASAIPAAVDAVEQLLDCWSGRRR